MRLPAFASAHSHAFQRAMRGKAQRPGRAGEHEDFWSWRAAMYALAASLDPERLGEVAEVAFREMADAGVRTVGEFHYLHHQPDGTPYAQRTLLSEVVIDAARRCGLRIALLRVAYARAGAGRPPEGVQRRFSDPDVETVLRDVEDLRAKYADAADVRIGIAPHSVRAVPREWIVELVRAARAMKVPLHMHVAEQPAEIEECRLETRRRPVELLAELDALAIGGVKRAPRSVRDRPSLDVPDAPDTPDTTRDGCFVAVHATHLAPHEARLLGEAGAFACICPTTERDLGDGIPDLTALVSAGVRVCVGIDSHIVCAPLEEIRALETNERLRTLRRTTLDAATLWRMGSIEGALACGFADEGGEVEIARSDPSLALVDPVILLDAVVFGAPGRVVQRAW